MREAIESMGGGISTSYDTRGLYLTYRDAVEGLTTVQDVLYPNDLALMAERRRDLQGMLTYQDAVEGLTTVQHVLYPDDLALVAE